MNILLDHESRQRITWLRNGRGRYYYVTEPPLLGILVSRCGSIDDMIGLVVDAAIGNEIGIDGWCVRGCSGKRHGKITLYHPVKAEAHVTLSAILDHWYHRYPL